MTPQGSHMNKYWEHGIEASFSKPFH